MKPSAFEYKSPATLSEAVCLLAAGNGNAKLIAGGQSLMPMLAFRLAAPELLVDLKRIRDLNAITITEDGIALERKCGGVTSPAISGWRRRIPCWRKPSGTLRIIKSAIVALWEARWRMPIHRPRCRELP